MLANDLDPRVSTDDKVMRLAHPSRVPAASPELFDLITKALLDQGTWRELEKAFHDSNALSSTIAYELARKPEHSLLRQFVYGTSFMPGGSGIGHSLASLLALRHHTVPQPFFVFDDALSEMLLHTDLSDDVPVSMLSLPYSRCYVEFGKSRTLDISFHNEESGEHVLEGAYCEYGYDEGRPYLFVMLTGSPLGKSNALDDATFAFVLGMDDPHRSLADELRSSVEKADASAREIGLRTGAGDALAGGGYECVLLVAKALLYLALPEARRAVHPERTEAMKALAAKKSPAKRAKAERQARFLTDYVLVTAPPVQQVTEAEGDAAGASRTVKAHWRRGHYRMQPHGEGRALRKLILLKPVLVNASALGAAPVPAYRVR